MADENKGTYRLIPDGAEEYRIERYINGVYEPIIAVTDKATGSVLHWMKPSPIVRPHGEVFAHGTVEACKEMVEGLVDYDTKVGEAIAAPDESTFIYL